MDFLSKFFQRVEKDTILVTFDITNMYTNIQNDLGIEAIKFWIQEDPNSLPKRIPKEFIVEGVNLLPTAFYDFLGYGGGIFIPHPRKQC